MRHPWEGWLKSVPWVTHGIFDYFKSIAAQPATSPAQNTRIKALRVMSIISMDMQHCLPPYLAAKPLSIRIFDKAAWLYGYAKQVEIDGFFSEGTSGAIAFENTAALLMWLVWLGTCMWYYCRAEAKPKRSRRSLISFLCIRYRIHIYISSQWVQK